MCILYWRLFPLGILQNKKIRTRLSSNKRTSKHMTRHTLFFEFSLDTNDCSMYNYVIERTFVRSEGL